MINNNLVNTGAYDSYNKEVYFVGLKNNKEMVCSTDHHTMDDVFLRPPLWEDITSSIQNIDPENAMMLASLPSATQVSVVLLTLSYLPSLIELNCES